MNWVQKNLKTLIYIAFLVPILTVAFVSISHVASWYGLSNPFSWALYLSFGIEIAALSALAAISAQMGKKVYFPFFIVTLIQFIGNIFFAYQFIDITSKGFLDWVDLVDPLVSFMGVESGDFVGHKRFLALFAGGMLPIISLSFLHMLVKFEEEERLKRNSEKPRVDMDKIIDIDELSLKAGKIEAEFEKEKLTPTDEQIKLIEKYLKKIDEEKFNLLNQSNIEKEIIESIEKHQEEIITEEKPEEPIGTEEPETTIGVEETEIDILPVELLETTEEEVKKINKLSYINRNGPNILTQRI